jgi:excisionase family DNA binding protein
MMTITTREAAVILGVSERRVQILCKQRRIKGAKLVAGRAWQIPADFEIKPGTRGPKLK